MKPHDDYTNGDDESAEEGAWAEEEELSLCDAGWPARALAALNALRKTRQHYDTLLVARGVELAAHGAVLAAASPYLLEALAARPERLRLEHVEPDALRDLLEYAYTGRLRVRSAAAALQLYRAAWRLRVEPVRAHLAQRLLRRLTPPLALEVRALPDLAPPHAAQLDAYIHDSFAEISACAAFAALPQLRIDMLRETSAEDGDELPRAVAEAALVWLRDHTAPDQDVDELCARTHLLYVDGAGALRDCGELPAARGDAPELQEYRREAAERARAPRRPPAEPARDSAGPPSQGARAPPASCAVLAACRLEGTARGTRALVWLRGRLAAARVVWRAAGEGWAAMARGGVLGGARAEPEEGARRARLAHGRSAHGAAALGGRLLVCGGYDRARVLSAAELYEPASNEWSPLPALRTPRARFPLVRLHARLYAVGGSDGHNELDTMDEWCGEARAWRPCARLPLSLSHSAGAAHEARGALYAVGGWSGGLCLKTVLRYCARDRQWSDAPPLRAPRSQCAAALWRGALWAIGGCDAWHCLASTETLALGDGAEAAAWAPGPALPTARRSAGAAEWRGALVVAGGSDGAASLRRTEMLRGEEAAWRAGPALRRARAGLGLVALQDVLYAVGGFDGKEFLSCVECLYQPDGEWTTLCAPLAPVAPPGPAEEEPAPQ